MLINKVYDSTPHLDINNVSFIGKQPKFILSSLKKTHLVPSTPWFKYYLKII
jgi:hypothetical protein